MNKKFISKNEFIFRKILNSEDSLEILKNFIESMLQIKIKKIKLNPYLKQTESLDVANVRIETEEKEEINVGIQFIKENFIHTELFKYYSQIHLEQLKYDDKREFTNTITINILNFSYFASLKYDKKIKIKCNEKNIEELELYIIELPKFYCKDKLNMNDKEEWIIYIKGCKNETLYKIKNKNIIKLNEKIEKYWNKEKNRENKISLLNN